MHDCTECGGHGVRDIGTKGYCWIHLGELYLTFQSSSFDGIGLPVGPSLKDTLGANLYPLRCNQCDAGWDGFPGDPCEWCARSLELLTDHQRQLVLKPPEEPLDDKTRPDRVRGWIERLMVQVKSGLITEEEAEHAIARDIQRTG